MQTKYGVFNIELGGYVFYETKEQALSAFWCNVIATVKSHYHNTAYSTVIVNDDGTETWYNDSGEAIEKIQTAEEIKNLLEYAKISTSRILEKDEIIKVEIL